ncbi:MAG: hypothetical protein WBA74_22540, partial [Cyclobacteriaceae bacterium]
MSIAIQHGLQLHEIQNTCEKTILLKKIKPYVKAILKTKDFKALEDNLNSFHNSISSSFLDFYNDFIYSTNNLLTEKITKKLLLVDFTHTYLLQIFYSGPLANSKNPVNHTWIEKQKLDENLQGYAFTIEYVFSKIISKKLFNKAKLHRIHTASSLRDYIYIKDKKRKPYSGKEVEGTHEAELEIADLLGLEFDLSEQSCLDHFFYIISNEVIPSYIDKYKFPPYQVYDHLAIDYSEYNKLETFKQLLDGNSRLVSPVYKNVSDVLQQYPIDAIHC